MLSLYFTEVNIVRKMSQGVMKSGPNAIGRDAKHKSGQRNKSNNGRVRNLKTIIEREGHRRPQNSLPRLLALSHFEPPSP